MIVPLLAERALLSIRWEPRWFPQKEPAPPTIVTGGYRSRMITSRRVFFLAAGLVMACGVLLLIALLGAGRVSLVGAAGCQRA